MEYVTCEKCGKELPQANLVLHNSRCLQPPSLNRSSSDAVWQQQLDELKAELLQEFPQVSQETHAAHQFLLLAEDGVQAGKWESAFNHLFEAHQVARAVAEQVVVLERTQSEQVASITGESRQIARRLIDEAGGDADEAVDRAFLIHGLEDGHGQLELNSDDVDCSICCCPAELREAVRLQPCGHGWYCITCVQRTVDAKLEDGICLSSLTCLEPSCGYQLTERVLRALLTRAQIDCLHRRDLEAAVASSSDLRPCPTPDCPNRVALEDGTEPRLLCSFCGKEHCLLCSASPYHEGKSCEEHLAEVRASSAAGGEDNEEQFVQWMREVGAKQCPTCQMVVTKQNLEQQATQNAECHKMICRGCMTKFCFNCRAILTDSSCGCTPANHGFIDPVTGGFVSHRVPRPVPVAPKAKPKARLTSPAAKPKARGASPAAKSKARAASPGAKAKAGSPARQRSPAAASPRQRSPR
eukprot:TRINITY_DN20044_c0_g1_i1.p1 TRINITY_DN20044_c0_g1~~TRINITY_DN20044_c0_g1_i1.p1  ORF type:complete len:469 (-),score=87.24 TRINITY_DN20044_c0_g1_i1:247-1653(-)